MRTLSYYRYQTMYRRRSIDHCSHMPLPWSAISMRLVYSTSLLPDGKPCNILVSLDRVQKGQRHRVELTDRAFERKEVVKVHEIFSCPDCMKAYRQVLFGHKP